MNKISKLKIVTVFLMAMLIIFSAKSSFAQPITTIGNSTGNSTNNTPVNNIAQNNVTNNVVNTVAPEPVNNTVLPDTGASSSTGIIILMVLTSVSAVYTYIKVKEYNI